MENSPDIITYEEREILQEVMNIAFGKATADLAEVVDIFVELSVPKIEVISSSKVKHYIENATTDLDSIDMVKQHFWGRFKGVAILIMSSESGRTLLSIVQGDSEDSFDADPLSTLKKEALLEIGNILIGACIGKLTEILGDVVTYSPPVVVTENSNNSAVPEDVFAPDTSAIILKTVFGFEKKNVTGFLFLVTSDESIKWLKTALTDFMGQYE